MDIADTTVAKKVDTPANARRMGFNAEPAPDPWSSLMVTNIIGERYASAFQGRCSVLETQELMRW